MKTTTMNKHAMNKPLPTAGSRTTLRLRVLMEHQQRIEIGERIRALREASPHTNASIADAVGLGERAVANWMSGGTGITYANATKVAELFDVDLTWLWTGIEATPKLDVDTPDPFLATGPNADVAEQLRELVAGQLLLKTKLATLEKLLKDQLRQTESPARRRSTGSN